LGEPRYRIFEGHPHAAVPHDHRARAVVAFRDDPLEVAVLDGVILDVDGEPFVGGVARRPFGHGPRPQYSVHPQPQVEMVAVGRTLTLSPAGPMPAHSIGSATISFGLVSVPIKMFSAGESSAAISFNWLHKKDGARLKQQYVCSKDGEKVEKEDMIKGYEFA